MSQNIIRDDGVDGAWTARDLAGGTGIDYLACISFLNRPELLERAVLSIRDLWPGLVIIDQSAAGLAADHCPWMGQVAGVYRVAPGQISFTRMMNWAGARAQEWGRAHLVFMHNDAECCDGVASSVLAFARSHPEAGVVFTNYDAFAVFRTAAWREVGPWDESFRWYFADNDYYHRMRLCGWQCADFGGDKVRHEASQTLRSDPAIAAEVSTHWAWHEAHYRHKWGGPPGEERWVVPYNEPPR